LVTPFLSLLNIALCAHVIVTPEDNKIIVFNNGKPQGSKVSILIGGQIPPISTAGARLA
jgi:hypothetical protein